MMVGILKCSGVAENRWVPFLRDPAMLVSTKDNVALSRLGNTFCARHNKPEAVEHFLEVLGISDSVERIIFVDDNCDNAFNMFQQFAFRQMLLVEGLEKNNNLTPAKTPVEQEKQEGDRKKESGDEGKKLATKEGGDDQRPKNAKYKCDLGVEVFSYWYTPPQVEEKSDPFNRDLFQFLSKRFHEIDSSL